MDDRLRVAALPEPRTSVVPRSAASSTSLVGLPNAAGTSTVAPVATTTVTSTTLRSRKRRANRAAIHGGNNGQNRPPRPGALLYGLASYRGQRATQEDTAVVADLFGDGRALVYAVFDGHGGGFTSQWLRMHFMDYLRLAWTEHPADPAEALRWAFRRCDEAVIRAERAYYTSYYATSLPPPPPVSSSAPPPALSQWTPKHDTSGSTAAVLVCTPDRMYLAYAGDSECALLEVRPGSETAVTTSTSTGGEAATSATAPVPTAPAMWVGRCVTPPHKPYEAAERARIETAGGHVAMGRVNGMLAVSRAFGDSAYKEPLRLVTAEPSVCVLDRSAAQRFVVLASDGLWDVTPPDELPLFFHDLLPDTAPVPATFDATSADAAPSSAQQFAEARNDLARRAQNIATDAVFQRKSSDNTTVLIVPLGGLSTDASHLGTQ